MIPKNVQIKEYLSRINKVIDYIDDNIDFSPEDVYDVFIFLSLCISYYHGGTKTYEDKQGKGENIYSCIIKSENIFVYYLCKKDFETKTSNY